MKKLITILSGVVLVNLSMMAQGTISFRNIAAGFNQPIKDVNGVNIAAGAAYTIELLAGTTAGSVAPLSTPIVTSTWVGSGWFGVGDADKVMPGFAGGSFPFLQVRVWNNSGGVNSYAAALAAGQAYEPSAVWQLVAGGGISGLGNPSAVPATLAPALFGFTGFTLVPVPEPSTIALGVLGIGALLLRRYRK
jgi:hypothetical protein